MIYVKLEELLLFHTIFLGNGITQNKLEPLSKTDFLNIEFYVFLWFAEKLIKGLQHQLFEFVSLFIYYMFKTYNAVVSGKNSCPP